MQLIKSLVAQTQEIENFVQDQGLQMIGDQSYSQLNFLIWSQKKTQITLLKDQQFIEPDKLEKLNENENKNNNQDLWRIFQIIRPEEPKKIFWDLVGMGFIFIQMILIPLILTFSFDIKGGFTIFENIMDSYFIVDILLQFQTGYYHKGNYIYQRRMIALNYLKLWFWLDLISSFPYDGIISLTIDESNQKDVLSSQSASFYQNRYDLLQYCNIFIQTKLIIKIQDYYFCSINKKFLLYRFRFLKKTLQYCQTKKKIFFSVWLENKVQFLARIF